jgi:cytoskeletal protein RodZ
MKHQTKHRKYLVASLIAAILAVVTLLTGVFLFLWFRYHRKESEEPMSPLPTSTELSSFTDLGLATLTNILEFDTNEGDHAIVNDPFDDSTSE